LRAGVSLGKEKKGGEEKGGYDLPDGAAVYPKRKGGRGEFPWTDSYPPWGKGGEKKRKRGGEEFEKLRVDKSFLLVGRKKGKKEGEGKRGGEGGEGDPCPDDIKIVIVLYGREVKKGKKEGRGKGNLSLESLFYYLRGGGGRGGGRRDGGGIDFYNTHRGGGRRGGGKKKKKKVDRA